MKIDPGLIQQISLYGAAICVALTIYFFFSAVSVEKSPANRVKEMVESGATSVFDRSGKRMTEQMAKGIFSSWKSILFWAQITENYVSWTVGGILLRGVVLAAAASLLILLLRLPGFSWLLVPMAVFMPYLMVNGKANETKKLVTRLLPETATVIAAEMDAGATAAQAIGRAGELPGPLGRVITMAVSKARQSDRAMFSRGASKGVLMEELGKLNLAELSRFAMQLDRVAAKGVDASRIMVEIAKGLAREYKSQVQQTASNMDTELLIPMTLFFFMPFVVTILMPVIVSFSVAM